MVHLVVDLEATCWRVGSKPGRMEIIEIGAVKICEPSFDVVDEFSCFVRPVVNPLLSDFCVTLTGIRQEDVDGAEPFPVAFGRFVDWIGAPPRAWHSWGEYDLRQFRADARRHRLALPSFFESSHVNIKRAFAQATGVEPCTMKQALRLSGLPLRGAHHRGIDDARNIATLTKLVLSRPRRE